MKKVFVLGSINMDLVFSVFRIPKLGETIKSDSFLMVPGGKGANQAVASAKQGVKTYMIGNVGKDSLSEKSLVSLDESGVDTTFIEQANDDYCGVAGIIIEESDNRIITYSGANSKVNVERVKKIISSKIDENDILVSQLEINEEVILGAFEIAKKIGAKTVLNLAPAKKISKELISLTDVLVVNETELETLTNIYPRDENQIRLAFDRLFKLGTKAILLTLGKNGSRYCDKNKMISVKAYEIDVVDPTAAGDTYIGAFISKIITGNTISTSMKFATAASALAIQIKGAQASIPTKAMVDSLILEKGEIACKEEKLY